MLIDFSVIVDKVKRRRKKKTPYDEINLSGESVLQYFLNRYKSKSEPIEGILNFLTFFSLFLVRAEHTKPSKRPLTDAIADKGQQPKKRRKINKDADKEVSFDITVQFNLLEE